MAGLVEGGAVDVEELVIQRVDDGVVDGLFDVELEFWSELVDWDSDGGFDFIVVAMTGRVVALAEKSSVLFIGHCGRMKPMGSGKLILLAKENLVCIWFGHFY